MLIAFMEHVHKDNQWKLDKTLDFEHGGVPKHLGAIANAMDEWEGDVAEALGLSTVDVSSIKIEHKDNLKLQTRGALCNWKEKNGSKATYRNLLMAFLKAGKSSYAEAVCKTLDSEGGNEGDTVTTIDGAGCLASAPTVSQRSTSNPKALIPSMATNQEKKILEENEARIRKSFGHLIIEVQRVLKGKEIDMEEFIMFVKHQFPPEVITCIPTESEKIYTIFDAITSHCLWSYTHYTPLKSIAEEFAIDDAKSLIEQYEKELANFYATTRLADYISVCQDVEEAVYRDVPLAPNPAKYDREYYQILTIKLRMQVTNETLQYIADIWQAVAKFFLLPSLTALLDCVVAGSLVVSWFIPHHFAMQILVNSAGGEAVAFFRAHRITEVMIDDDCLYKCETTSDDTKLALLTACKEGNVDEVLELLGKLSDFDFSQYDESPLGVAASKSLIDIIQLLLLYPFDVNGRDKKCRTALMYASEEGTTDIAQILLEHNADVDARMENDATALMVAIIFGRVEVVELLIKHNATVNTRMKNGRTPLMLACRMVEAKIVELLLSNNADVNAKTEGGWTALMMASMEGRSEVVKVLIKHNADVNAMETNGRTALMMASFYGRLNVAELLIKQNADVNAKEIDGVTALMLAIGHGIESSSMTDIVELLINNHANVNAMTEGGVTALMMACQEGKTDLVELLIKHNTDVNAMANNGFTALQVASSHGHTGPVKTLLETNADPNIADNETNWTPLFFASKYGHADIVQLLIEHGADVEFKDKNGVTALEIAQSHNHTEIFDLLRSNESQFSVPNEDTKRYVLNVWNYIPKLFDKQKKLEFSQKFDATYLPERI